MTNEREASIYETKFSIQELNSGWFPVRGFKLKVMNSILVESLRKRLISGSDSLNF
jgi:hypothetical protein